MIGTDKVSPLHQYSKSQTRHTKERITRLNSKDKKRIAREIAASDFECKWTEEALAEKLGVIQQTVNTRSRSLSRKNRGILPPKKELALKTNRK